MDDTYFDVPRGIIRFEQGRTKGWWVRVLREGAYFRKLFSDSIYGSPELALEHAKIYLEELKKELPRSRRVLSNKIGRGNGPIPGVWKQKSKSRGHEYLAWHVMWTPVPGKHKTKSFSINKYGDTGAMRKAIAFRLEKLEEMSDEFPEEYYEQSKTIRKDLINTGLLEYAIPDGKGSLFNLLHYDYEGQKKYSLHLLIERSKSLRESKIRKFIEDNGKIFCELCNTNLKERYPWIRMDYIEVHHIVPLSELNEPKCNSLDDLLLLCPNCHTSIHQGDPQDNLLEAMLHFEKELI